MRKYYKLLFLTFNLLITSFTIAQKAEYKFNKDSSAVSVNVKLSETKLAHEDKLNKKQGLPLRISINFPFKYKLADIGTWKDNPDNTKSWKFELNVPGAKGLIVRFSDFYIPKGAALHIYNISKRDFDSWIYKHEDNPQGGAYSLEVFSQDNIVFEYVADKNVTEKPRFEALDFGYKYKSSEIGDLNGFHASGPCMVNVNCPEGFNWQKQKKGVVRLRINTRSGSYLCSGTLINNTRNDKTPYVLTAQHCFPNNLPSDVENTEFFFDYELSGCDNKNERPTYKYKKGASALVLNPINGGTDGALIKMNDTIPDDWVVYFNGWNLQNTNYTISNGAVIHHPSGDVKKISLFKNSLYTTTFDGEKVSSEENAHWLVKYSMGSTEGGSSGAPLFDEKGLVVGTLTGGYSSCKNYDSYGSDYYGKMYYHWSHHTDSKQQMKKYLDPDNTGKTKFEGIFNLDKSDLLLSSQEISVEATYSSDVYILNGNGQYSAISDNISIATVEVINNNLIRINGIKAGRTKITVQNEFGINAVVEVTVTPTLSKTLRLSSDIIVVAKDKNSDIDIISGNGKYELTIADQSIATATLLDNKKIEVQGIILGKTTLTITDSLRKEITIPVIVMNLMDIYVAPGELNVRINNGINIINWVTISDLSGRMVFDSGKVDNNIFWTDLTRFPRGAYIVTVKLDDNKKITKKVAW